MIRLLVGVIMGHCMTHGLSRRWFMFWTRNPYSIFYATSCFKKKKTTISRHPQFSRLIYFGDILLINFLWFIRTTGWLYRELNANTFEWNGLFRLDLIKIQIFAMDPRIGIVFVLKVECISQTERHVGIF